MKNILDNEDWNLVSLNPNLTMKDILNNPDKPWNWRCIIKNTFKSAKQFRLKMQILIVL